MAVMAVLAIAAAAAQVASKISEAHVQEAQADANVRMADQNRAIAGEQANAREESQRRQGMQYLGRQTAAAAQSGVDITSGSSLDVARQSATGLELDAQTVRYQGLMQGFSFQREAGLQRAKAHNIEAGVPLGVANTILGAATSYYGMAGGMGGGGGGVGASGVGAGAVGGGVGSAGSIF